MARKNAARSHKASCAEKKFKVGNLVSWDDGGKGEGKVVKVATTGGQIKGASFRLAVAASSHESAANF